MSKIPHVKKIKSRVAPKRSLARNPTRLVSKMSRLEEWFPFTGDPDLKQERVKIAARVEWNEAKGEKPVPSILIQYMGDILDILFVHPSEVKEPPAKVRDIHWAHSWFPVPQNLDPEKLFSLLKAFVNHLAGEFHVKSLLDMIRNEKKQNKKQEAASPIFFYDLLDRELSENLIAALCVVATQCMYQIILDWANFPEVTHEGDNLALRELVANLRSVLNISPQDLRDYALYSEPLSIIPQLITGEHYENPGIFYKARDGHLVLLALYNLPIGELPRPISKLGALETLLAVFCKIQGLPPWLGDLPNLRTLSFWNNLLVEIPSWIHLCDMLVNLDLSGNQLSSLPPEVGQIVRLKTLGLSGNPLKSLPADFAHLSTLEELNIGPLSDLASNLSPIGELPHLQRLKLHGLKEQTPISWLYKLKSLKELDLRGNNLTQFPLIVTHLTNLEVLDLNFNHIPEIPPEISMMQALRIIKLDSNNLTKLPESFAKLPNIETIGLSDNLFTEFPTVLCHIPRLRGIAISQNLIKSLPDCIKRLSNLSYLFIAANPIIKIPDYLRGITTEAFHLLMEELAKQEQGRDYFYHHGFHGQLD